MFMRSIISFFAVLLVLSLGALCSPVPTNETVIELAKRTTHSGKGTWFDVGLGNCGKTNKNSDHIVAISKSLYDANHGSNCGQWIKIKDTKNGKVAYGLTRDSCPGCSYYDLDLSPSLFQQFDSLGTGVIHVSWNFMAKGWSP